VDDDNRNPTLPYKHHNTTTNHNPATTKQLLHLDQHTAGIALPRRDREGVHGRRMRSPLDLNVAASQPQLPKHARCHRDTELSAELPATGVSDQLDDCAGESDGFRDEFNGVRVKIEGPVGGKLQCLY
jgi:hypothetical protein